MQLYLEKYINSLSSINEDCKTFMIRQIGRMPDYFRLGVKIICLIFYLFRLPPKKLEILNKLFSSLITIKKYES